MSTFRNAIIATLVLLAGGAAADPLDRTKGTEGWGEVSVDLIEERRAWRSARSQWRRARAEISRQRKRSRVIARRLARAAVLRRENKRRAAVLDGHPASAKPKQRVDKAGQPEGRK